MAVDTQLVSNVLDAAAECQPHYDALKAAVANFNAANDVLRRAILADAPGVPLLGQGQVEPITNFALQSLVHGNAFDFSAAATKAWGNWAGA